MKDETKFAIPVIVSALGVRSVSAVVTTITNLNPDSQYDAVSFAATAQRTVGRLSGGEFQFLMTGMDIYQLWGTFLAPFWLLPGPSGLYGRLGNAFLGAFAIYNVYIIARYYHSRRAGYLATLPMIFYPSFVAVHGTLLREAFILFGLTTVTRLVIVPSRSRSRRFTLLIGGLLLYGTYRLRAENEIIYVIAIGSGIAVYLYEQGHLTKRTIGGAFTLSPVVLMLSLPLIEDGIEFLATTRQLRAYGGAVYFPEFVPQSISDIVLFSWIGAAYFLYAPFPWMVDTIPGILVSVEGLLSIVYSIAAIWGSRKFTHRNRVAGIGLLTGLFVAVVLYGIGTANYGTGMRHRQMFLWVVFLFGAVGIADKFQVAGIPGFCRVKSQR
jgi:hypothetical protein